LDQVPDIPDSQPTAIDRMASTERGAAIRRALDNLPPNQRLAIVLRHYQELDYRTISESMGITEKAVERLLARGRESMRQSLAGILTDTTREGDSAS
jgi:RNA polymerase sigma-70 factor (ECF subfamily)